MHDFLAVPKGFDRRDEQKPRERDREWAPRTPDPDESESLMIGQLATPREGGNGMPAGQQALDQMCELAFHATDRADVVGDDQDAETCPASAVLAPGRVT